MNSNTNKRESYVSKAARHQSTYNHSAHLQLSDQINKTSDPKELEFYKSLLSKTSHDEPLEKTPENGEEVLKISIMHSTDEEEPKLAPQTIETVTTEESDLSSTLADYKLFTERALNFNDENSPTTSSFALASPASHSNSIASSSSLPSFTSSIDTLSSKASIIHTCGALWVGIESEDLEDDLETKNTKNKKNNHITSWCDVDSEEIFTEDIGFMKIGNRTSLMFI